MGQLYLAARTKARDTTSDGQHPEHAVDGVSIGCSGQDASHNNHRGGEDDGELSSHIITGQADHDLAEDLTNKESIGDTSADDGVILLRVFLLEQDIGHCHQGILISI